MCKELKEKKRNNIGKVLKIAIKLKIPEIILAGINNFEYLCNII